MNPIDQANQEVVADVFSQAMEDLSKEGIPTEQAFVSETEALSIMQEVDARVIKDEDTQEITDWVKDRFRTLLNRQQISETLHNVFDDTDDFTYGIAA